MDGAVRVLESSRQCAAPASCAAPPSVVDTAAGALAEARDLVQPLERGVIDGSRIVAELSQLLGGAVPGRTGTDEITLFKSVGTAPADPAAAQLVVRDDRRARQPQDPQPAEQVVWAIARHAGRDGRKARNELGDGE